MIRCVDRVPRMTSLRVAPRDIIASAAWILIGLCGCFCWLGPLCVEAMRPARGRVNDFYQDWASARNYRVGLPIYTRHSTSIPRYLGLPVNPVKDIEYNAHPPTSVLLISPFGRLDYPDAVLTWNLISLAAFLASLAILAAVLPVPRSLFLPVLALLPFCHPLYGNLHQAQLTLVLVFLVTSIWALERSGRPDAAGVLLGLAAAIKLFPAYLAVYFAARRRWRPLVAAAATAAALTLTSAMVLGNRAFVDYLRVVLPAQSQFQGLGYNLSIAGLWHKLLDPAAEVSLSPSLGTGRPLAVWGTLVSDLAVTAIVATVASRARTPARRDIAYGLALTGMLLVSPVTWDVSLVFLSLPLAVLARSAGRSGWIAPALILLVAVISMPQIALTGLALSGRPPHEAPWAFVLGASSIKFYALLAIFAMGLAASRSAEEKHEVAGHPEVLGIRSPDLSRSCDE